MSSPPHRSETPFFDVDCGVIGRPLSMLVMLGCGHQWGFRRPAHIPKSDDHTVSAIHVVRAQSERRGTREFPEISAVIGAHTPPGHPHDSQTGIPYTQASYHGFTFGRLDFFSSSRNKGGSCNVESTPEEIHPHLETDAASSFPCRHLEH